jgi:hypothetical protein
MSTSAAYDHHVSFPPWFLETELPLNSPLDLLDA